MLPNGLKILIISDKYAEKQYAAIDVNTGSWFEPKEVNGLAHLMEHSLFLQNKQFPTVDEFDYILS